MIPTLVELGRYLEQLAKNGTVVCYSDVDDHFRISFRPSKDDWKDHPLYCLYGSLDNEDMRALRPLRTSMIVKKSGVKKTVPSAGYFKRLSEYRKMPIPKTAPKKREAHARELKAVMEHYNFRGTAAK